MQPAPQLSYAGPGCKKLFLGPSTRIYIKKKVKAHSVFGFGINIILISIYFGAHIDFFGTSRGVPHTPGPLLIAILYATHC